MVGFLGVGGIVEGIDGGVRVRLLFFCDGGGGEKREFEFGG